MGRSGNDDICPDSMSRVCHKLLQPVAVIQAYAELLDDEIAGRLTDGQKEQVVSILDAAGEFTGLVDKLYSLAAEEAS